MALTTYPLPFAYFQRYSSLSFPKKYRALHRKINKDQTTGE